MNVYLQLGFCEGSAFALARNSEVFNASRDVVDLGLHDGWLCEGVMVFPRSGDDLSYISMGYDSQIRVDNDRDVYQAGNLCGRLVAPCL